MEWSASPGNTYLLQTSPDLKLWTAISTNLATGGLIRTSEAAPVRPGFRIYRLLQLP